MIRPSSRSCSCNRVSNEWQAWGVRPARRNWTSVRPIWVMTGTKRTVKGNKEVAKCVAKSSREPVAWSIEAAFLHHDRALADATRHLTARAAGEIARAAGVGRVTPFHFSGRYLARSEEIAEELTEAFDAPGAKSETLGSPQHMEQM